MKYKRETLGERNTEQKACKKASRFYKDSDNLVVIKLHSDNKPRPLVQWEKLKWNTSPCEN